MSLGLLVPLVSLELLVHREPLGPLRPCGALVPLIALACLEPRVVLGALWLPPPGNGPGRAGAHDVPPARRPRAAISPEYVSSTVISHP